MKKNFTLFLLTLLCSFTGALGQADITIGSGTAGNTATTWPAPLQDRDEGSRAQFLYRASELTAAGMAAGNILSIKYNITALNGTGLIENLIIRIGSTTANTLTATTWETLNGVVSTASTDYTPLLGTNTITFPTPFLWDGTSNIIIETCNGEPTNATGTWYTFNPTFPWTTGLTFNGSHSYNADNVGNSCGTTATANTGNQTSRPNITFSWIPATPCTGTPTGVTASANPAFACLGTPFTVSLGNVPLASGITYQWQSSGDNITWTNILGATGNSYTSTQTITTYYRAIVTCANQGGGSAPSSSAQVTTTPAVNGTFTINSSNPTGGTNFQTFNDAYNYIKCGINGPVVFNVLNGTGQYTEQLTMTSVPGTSIVNTVTFKGNGVASIGFASTNTNERAIIKLKGTRHIIFDSLVINATSGTYGYGVQLMTDADSNIVRNCIINSSTTSTTQNFAGIVVNGTDAGLTALGTAVLCDYNTFSKNTITGGYYGLTLVATFTGGANGFNRILQNNISDFYLAGMYIAGSYSTLIESNTISRPTRSSVGEFTGILFTAQKNTSCVVTKNRIKNPFGGALTSTAGFFGIHFNASDASSGGADNIVSNNLIYQVNGNGAQTGIANTGSDYAIYLHNTISLDDQLSSSTATTRGFFQSTTASSLYYYNNLVSITRGGAGVKHAIYLAGILPAGLDNNNYYVNASAGTNFIGFYTTNHARLLDWKTATGMEPASLSSNPAFVDVSNENYTPGNAGIDNKGAYVGIDTDIINTLRSQTVPDIGTYEFTPPACSTPPVTGTTVLSATTVCQNVQVLLSLNIGAYGSAQTFQWQTATSVAGPYSPLGSPMLTPDTTIMSSSTLYYRVAVSCGSTTVFTNEVLLNVNPALPTGTYTIDKNTGTTYVPGTAGGNFNSFAAAKAAMNCGIIGGPVLFNVIANSGPYNEQLKLDSIKGTSPTNTITFNGFGNTITFNSTNSNERAVIKLNAADYIIFDSLTIDAGTGTYGYGVQLINNADINTFRKCTIVINSSATTNYAGVVVNATDAGTIATGSTLCDGNIFDNNRINGGYYGITLVGGTTAASFITGNTVINNLITNFFSTGIHLVGTSNTLIERNTFTRPATTTSAAAVYGINITTAVSNGLTITKNRFTKFFSGLPASTASFYGIYHNSVDAATVNEISNNLFYDLDGNGPLYCFYNQGSNNVSYYHNTLSLDNTVSTSTAATVGIYQTTLATGLEFKNNIITIKRGGTGTKHAIYNATSTTEFGSDYNDFFINAGGSNNFIGYFGTNRSSLNDWQIATGEDVNSFNIDPIYSNPSVGDYRPAILPLDNKGTAVGVLTDILGVTRGAGTTPTTRPDIGAYEFAPPVCTSPPVAGNTIVSPNNGVCLESPVHLTLNGNSPIGSLTFQWQSSSNGTNWTNISGVLYTPDYDTLAATDTYYRAAVTCNGITTFSTPAQIALGNVLLAGNYTINGSAATNYPTGTNFQTFKSAVNAMLCGVAGKVVFNVAPGTYNEQIRIPYIAGTSNLKTVTFQGAGTATASNLTYSSTAAVSNYTLRLDSTKNFIFKNLTITAANAPYGRAVELTNNASADTITNCNILVPAATSVSNEVVGIYANAFKGRDNVIKGNTISSGSNGIYFAGSSTASLSNPTNVIDSNTVTGAYSHGILVQYTNRIKVTRNRITITGTPAPSTAGIYLNFSDTAFQMTANTVRINNVTTGPIHGIYVSNSRSVAGDSSVLAANTILAESGNTNTIYGLTITASKVVNAVNNVIAISSAGATTYGLYNQNNTDQINYYNNSVHIPSVSSNSYAGYFTQGAAGQFNAKNNIFSNKGGGRALFVNNPSYFSADYNMLYTTGASLVQVSTGAVTSFATLQAWRATWNWDRSSIGFAAAFVSDTDLRPDVSNPNVWAMHGRGVQVRGNTFDFNNNYRPDFLTAGVPDLGAYEFFPSVQPPVLTANPTSPAANSTQSFTFGTDTVMKITWTAAPPPGIQVRRFSGLVPSGLQPGTDSMFFYTQVNIPGGSNYNYSAKLYYVESWLGSIPNQSQLGLGRTTQSNAWVVGSNSRINVAKKEIRQDALVYLDRFTGMTNPFAQPEVEDSSSNRGRDFWVGYQRTNGFTGANGGGQEMVLYMGAAAQTAHVTVTIEGTSGTPWVRNYTVPANSALASDFIPKTTADDARLFTEGVYSKKGIHIVSDVPIVAYAHIYENTNSGATMLMPTTVWGYEYYTLSSRQYYTTTGSASVFHVVAKEDSTWVEINPSKNTIGGWVPNGGTQPNGSYLVKLNKGDAYQVIGGVLSGSEGLDLTGSYVKSVSNAQGKCSPIAVFAGSTRTAIGCGTTLGSNGDLIIQQIFPYQAWGTKYATAPASYNSGPNASSDMRHIYRVLVKDTLTDVKRNGVILPRATLINKRYYQYESNTGDLIESNKPILVAQFMSSSNSYCDNTTGVGDPEMFYLSPLEQSIKGTQFYRNNQDAIDVNFITLIIPTEGLATLKIDGVNWQAYPAADRFAKNHPNLNGYSIVTKKWDATPGSSFVESEHPFTGIVYGEGGAESYGYNLGTLVKNLNNFSSINNVLNTGSSATDYTCKGAPFQLTALLPLKPDSILWKLNGLSFISPNADITQQTPPAVDTVIINGQEYYAFKLPQSFTATSAGTFTIPIQFWSAEIESCDKKKDGSVIIQVLPSPVTDFRVTYANGGTTGCEGDVVSFSGDLITQNGIALNQWNWTFSNGTTPTGQNLAITYPAAGTFPVSLRGITADGCISDTTKFITINPKPIVNVVVDSVAICAGAGATFNIDNPVAGVTYNWYNAATAGTLVGSGTTFTATNVTPPTSFYVEGISASGCISLFRKKVTVGTLPTLVVPVVTVNGSTANSVSFSWAAVAGAVSYQVSTDNGATFTVPSSSATGTTHVVTGLTTLQSASLIVRAVGQNVCQNSVSTAISGCANSAAQVVQNTISVCTGTTATFTVQSAVAGITYTWWSATTGGTQLATGTTFTTPAVNGLNTYYLQQASAGGCLSSTRTPVTVTILSALPVTVVTATAATVNSVTFSWATVTGATAYEVSVNNGTSYTTPSTGATGLSHTVTGLTPQQSVTLIVRALGTIACQTSTSAPAAGTALGDQIFVPNTFTPNGDGRNDYLEVFGNTIREVRFLVFNQWGEKIAETVGTTRGTNGGIRVWDGLQKGKLQPVGVYIFVCKITQLDGTIVDKKGSINLVR